MKLACTGVLLLTIPFVVLRSSIGPHVETASRGLSENRKNVKKDRGGRL